MTLPLTTNSVTIMRDVPETADPYVTAPSMTVATGVRCVIGSLGGNESNVGGSQTHVTAHVNFDLGVDVTYRDRLLDEVTGDLWEIAWTRSRLGLGLDHIECGVFLYEGASLG